MPIANDTEAAPGHIGVNPAMDRILSRAAGGNSSAASADFARHKSAVSASGLPADSAQTIVRDNNKLDSGAVVAEDYDDYESLPDNTTLAHHLAAGAFAGIMEHTVMFPVDAIKTRMQVAGSANIYSGIINAITKISASEGSASLWRGVTSVIFGAGPAHAVYFAVYEAIKQGLGGNEDGHHHPLVTSLAGAGATTCSDALMNPFDVIKQRMQIFGSKYRSFTSCASDIYRKEGFRAFYVSYPTTLVMNVPFTATNFTIYESASKILNPNKKHDPITHCLAGGIAGGTAAAITTPLDVVKTLLQTKTMHCYDHKVGEVNSFVAGARYIYDTQGMRGFFRGLRPRVVASVPSTAICWTAYEMAKFYISKTDIGGANPL